MSAYRYYKWTVTATRGGGLAQAQEFYLRNDGSPIAWPGGSVATNPGGTNPGGQEASKLIDASTATKWIDLDGATSVIHFDCLVATEVKGYDYMTGDDANDRDPTAWTFEGSNDDSSWDLLDSQSPGSGGITTDRLALAGPWDYESPSAGDPTLVVDDEPTDTASGYPIDPPVVVRATTDGATTDTAFTGDVTASLVGAGGVLYGTVTVAAIAGIATFDELVPCIAGTYVLEFTAAGYILAESANFSVTTGAGSTTTVIGGDMSSVQIRRNEATASLRRIPLTIRDDAGAAWAGDIAGVKAKLSVNGATETDSPADIVRVAGTRHYVELAQPYTDIPEGSVISARVIADTGRLEASSDAQVIPADSYADAVSETSLVRSIVRAANGADGFEIVRDPDNSQIQLNIPGVGVVNIPATFAQNAPAVTSLGVA